MKRLFYKLSSVNTYLGRVTFLPRIVFTPSSYVTLRIAKSHLPPLTRYHENIEKRSDITLSHRAI